MGAVDTEAIAPVFIDGNGSVIGSHGLRSMRIDRRHYVKITAFGKEFVLNMTRNRDFMASNILVEHRGNSTMETLGAFNADCYHKGLVSVGNVTAGKVALSSCRGLVRGTLHQLNVTILFYFLLFLFFFLQSVGLLQLMEVWTISLSPFKKKLTEKTGNTCCTAAVRT